MNQNKKNGAAILVRALENAGVRKIFTLSGNHIMPVYDAIFNSKIDLIHTRHEAAAVHMADAWSRLTGEVGIALVTGGPGHANAISALYTAEMAESAVLLLSGHAPLNQLGKGAFQEMRQADIAAPLTKAAWVCQKIDDVAIDTAKAIRIAKSGRPGPVHLSLPMDVLEAAQIDGTVIPSVTSYEAERTLSPASEMQDFITKLILANRPLVLSGPSMQSKNGKVKLCELENSLGIPVIGMESPRGIGDPSLGSFSEVLSKADCVLLLGKKVDFTLKFAQSPGFHKDCIFLQIDPDEAEIGRAKDALGERLVHSLISDIPSAIEAFIHSKKTVTNPSASWQQEVKDAIEFRPSAWFNIPPRHGNLHPVQALLPLQEILDGHLDSVLISDGGEIGQWAQACLKAPNRIINGVAGSIGAGLPFAVAASLAKPNVPIIAVMGDGTFGFHSAEIDTAVRYKLPFTLVIGNDARWNAEYQIQVRDYGEDRAIGCELLPTSYEKVCEAFGGYGEMVIQSSEVLPAAKRATASKLPSCINIMIEGLAAPNIKRA
ncbi:MAG: thiamine pyrophosphate-binding protein [Polynucleobacter sp.]|uniref:thiamine pyrophosphate-binding protein n=1 Tax=Polynucleobacter sp. TaxID=2029855 RepID=UPI0027227956|nr:thiamine pyrophosphate-binding protein [Polynucleobacter sp.]MDO8713465.1 thiamine pyrophosphate-binding protein [Polynucleobacter sp.]